MIFLFCDGFAMVRVEHRDASKSAKPQYSTSKSSESVIPSGVKSTEALREPSKSPAAEGKSTMNNRSESSFNLFRKVEQRPLTRQDTYFEGIEARVVKQALSKKSNSPGGVNYSFRAVYKECKNVYRDDPSVINSQQANSVQISIKSFQKAVAILSSAYAQSANQSTRLFVSKLQKIATRVGGLTPQEQGSVAPILDSVLTSNFVDVNDLPSSQALVEKFQKALDDARNQLQLSKQELESKLAESMSKIEKLNERLVESQQSFIENSRLSKELEVAKVEVKKLQKQLEEIVQPEFIAQGGLDLAGLSTVGLNNKVNSTKEGDLIVQERIDEQGRTVKRSFAENEGTLIPLVDKVRLSSSEDGLISTSEVYRLDEHGARVEKDPLFVERERFIEKNGERVLVEKQNQDLLGNVISTTEYLPEGFDLKQEYDLSGLGFNPKSQLTIMSYEKTTSAAGAMIKIKAESGGVKVEIQTNLKLDGAGRVVQKDIAINKDSAGVFRAIQIKTTEKFEYDGRGNLKSKLSVITGKPEALKYVFDEQGRVVEVVIYAVARGGRLTEKSSITKEYMIDDLGNELVVDRDQHGNVLRKTVKDQFVAGLFGVSLQDVIGSFDAVSLKEMLKDQDITSLSKDAAENIIKTNIEMKIKEQIELNLGSLEHQSPKAVALMVQEVYNQPEFSMDKFVGEKVGEVLLLRQELESQVKSVKNPRKSLSEQEVALAQKAKVARDAVKAQAEKAARKELLDRVTQEYNEAFDNYSQQDKINIINEYIDSFNRNQSNKQKIFTISLSPEAKIEKFLSVAKKARLEELINQAYKNQAPEIQAAGKAAVDKFNQAEQSQADQQKQSASEPVPPVVRPKLSFLDAINSKAKKSEDVQVSTESQSPEVSPTPQPRMPVNFLDQLQAAQAKRA
ncbi:hypothetical protein KBC04_01115 [Candidatus Babeliales bacterium]|nr:hypothetical protein [Candidatus Babeliales bacterium]MBP9843668.1 hypothetical protein [Candidatus Babeliales bacterium]